MMNDAHVYDVVIVGGGTAGAVAAIQAGRLGLDALLVEKTGMLGGTITVGGVTAPGIFHAWGKQVISGIGWELVRETVELGGETMPDFSLPDQPHHYYQVRFNPAIFACLADEKVTQSKCAVRLHSLVGQAQFRDNLWHLTLCGKEGLYPVRARTVIDATGDANVAALARYPLERDERLQPGTLIVFISGYEPDSLDYDTIKRAAHQAVADNQLNPFDVGWSNPDAVESFLKRGGGNINHILNVDGTDSVGKTDAELAGRASVLRMFRFLKKQPGLKGLTIRWMAPECGIRETVRIVGRARITRDDYMSGKVWPDAICYCFYPIDWHSADGVGVDKHHLAEGVVPTMPRGAMLPPDGQQFLAVGRIISGDQMAHSAYRVQAPCMATGQAASVIAALAVRQGCDVADVPMADIRRLLQEQGAIVPPIE